MKDNPTIIKFKCIKCNKEVEIQTVLEILYRVCSDCYLKGE